MVNLIGQYRVFDMDALSKQQHVIQELIDTGVIQTVRAAPVPMSNDGYNLYFYDKKAVNVAVLAAQRGGMRDFKTLDAVAAFVKKMGLSTFSVTIRTH